MYSWGSDSVVPGASKIVLTVVVEICTCGPNKTADASQKTNFMRSTYAWLWMDSQCGRGEGSLLNCSILDAKIIRIGSSESWGRPGGLLFELDVERALSRESPETILPLY